MSLKNACTNHPYVRYDTKRSHFLIHNKPTRGLTTGLLHNKFYPSYAHELATQEDNADPSIVSAIKSVKHNDLSRFYKRKKTSAELKRCGMQRGKKLGKNLDKILRFQRLFGLHSSRFGLKWTKEKRKKLTLNQAKKELELSPIKPEDWKKNESYCKEFTSLMNDSNTHARVLWQEMLDQKLTLMHLEVPCGIPNIAATALDGVAVDENNRIVPLEFKTGGNDMLKHTGHSMRAPFQQQKDHRLNQALLQLGFGSEMFSRSNPHLDSMLERGRLFVVSPQKAVSFVLPDWVANHLSNTSALLL